jgi:hypothetical protein
LLRRASLLMFSLLSVAPVAAIEPASPPAVTQALPSDIPGVVLINTTPGSWSALDRFNPMPIPLGAGASFFLPPWLNYETDVRSWLGDRVALAVLPVPPEAKPESFNNHTLLVAPVTNNEALQPLLDKLKANRGKLKAERQYNGATILEWEPTQPPTTQPPDTQPPTTESSCLPVSIVSFLPTASQTCSSALSSEPISLLWQVQLAQLRFGLVPTLAQSQPVSPTPTPTESPEALPPWKADPSEEPSSPETTPEPTPVPRNDGLAIAVLPNYLAIASTAKPLEQWVDAQARISPLANNPRFQRTMSRDHFNQALLIGYGDIAGLAQFATAATSIPTPTPAPFPPPTAKDFEELTKVYNTIDLLTWVDPNGIRSQSNAYYTTPQPDFATADLPDANQIVTRLPAATYLSANSRNFKQQWQSFAAEIDADPPSQFITKSIRDWVRSATGLDLDKDLVPWMDGQYVFFMFPTDQGFFPAFDRNVKLGLSMMLQTSDRPAAEAALAKFTQYVKALPGGQLTIRDLKVQGQPIVSWEGVDGSRRISIFSYGWVNDDTLILTTGSGTMPALNPKPYIPLDQTPTFQTATTSLPRPNEGYFYVNMGSSLSFLYSLLLPNFGSGDTPEIRQIKQALGIFRSISTTNSATADRQQFDSFLVLAPARKPQATSE